jgi:hypothetical protein
LLKGNEINDVSLNRLLATEFNSLHLPVPQMVPKSAFHVSGVIAQYPGTALQGMSWFHGRCALVISPLSWLVSLVIPPTLALPREGGGNFISAAAAGINAALITPALDGRGPGGG